MRTRAQRQAWWASLSAGQQAAYIQRRQAKRAEQPNAEALEASARLDLATELHLFMHEVPDADVRERLELQSGQRPIEDLPRPRPIGRNAAR